MSFAPLIPVWLVLLVAAALGVTLWRAYRRPSWPMLPRALALALLTVVLLEPVTYRSEAGREPPRLVLALDCSQSMAADDGGTATRFATAAAALERAAAGAGPRWSADWCGLSEALAVGRPTAPASGSGSGTRFDALASLAAAERRPAAVIIASDGGDRGDQAPDRALADAGIPVFCLAVGSRRPAANAALRLDAATATVFPGQELPLAVTVTASTPLIGQQARLVVESIAGDGAATALDERTVTLAARLQIDLMAPVGSEPGERLYRARLTPLVGEAATADNQAWAQARVVDRQLRVIAVEGQPYWDTAFAVRALRRDRQVGAVTLHKVGPRVLRHGGDGPATLDAAGLAGVDTLLLGGEVERLLDEPTLQAIRAWVAEGGGLILLGLGERPATLAGLDPVLRRRAPAESASPVVTPAALRLSLLPADGGGLPPLSIGAAAGLRPLAEVLLGDERRPAVATQRHGQGRVVAVNAEGLWRWRLEGHAELAERFWRQLVKSVARSGQDDLTPDRPRYRVGAIARIAVTAGDTPLVARLPDGGEATAAPDAGVCTLPLPTAGLYRLRRGEATATIVAEEDVREAVEIERRDERLAQLAAATGGEAVDAAQAEELGRRLARRADLQIEAPRPERLVTTPWWLLAVAALLGGEWWLRRRLHGTV